MRVHAKLQGERKINDEAKINAALKPMDAKKKWAIMRAVEGKTSNWLTVLPVARHHFNLSPTEFVMP